eukprot:1875482-Amphidinium_carterae.3
MAHHTSSHVMTKSGHMSEIASVASTHQYAGTCGACITHMNSIVNFWSPTGTVSYSEEQMLVEYQACIN